MFMHGRSVFGSLMINVSLSYLFAFRKVLPLVLLLVLALVPAKQTQAADIFVSNATELQNAVSTATAADTIILSGNITLDGSISTFAGTDGTNATAIINGPRTVNIEGAGFSISRTGGTFRFFQVASGATLTLSDVTLTSGTATNGGAIYNAGTLNLYNAKFSDNSATSSGGAIYNLGTLTADVSQFNNNTAVGGTTFLGGGGIYNIGGDITVRNSRFNLNRMLGAPTSGGGGAAIANMSRAGINGSAEIVGSTFTNNTSANNGGAIFNVRGDGLTSESTTMTIEGSTFDNNTAYTGGAIYNTEEDTVLTANRITVTNNTATVGSGDNSRGGGGIYNRARVDINDSIITGNQAGYRGGAIFNYEFTAGLAATLNVNNTLIANNTLAGAGQGAGIFNRQRGQTRLNNVTLTNNTGASQGGGIYNWRPSTQPTDMDLVNVTLADNGATTGPQLYSTEGGAGSVVSLDKTIISGAGASCALVGPAAPTDLGDNIASDASCGVTVAVANLAALANNGGFSQTRALNPGSGALGIGTSCLALDQRGVVRPGTGCDAGAFEDSGTPALVSFSLSAPTVTEGTTTSTVTVTVNNTSGSQTANINAFFAVGGTAARTSDYTDGTLSDGSFTINAAAGATATRTFTINPLTDSITDGGETVTLNLDFSGFGTFTGANNQTVTILDAAPPTSGTVTVNPTELNITEGGDGTYTISVDTPPVGSEVVTVTLTPSDPALAALSTTTVTFTAADFGAKTITVTPVDDGVDTGSRTLTIAHAVTVTNPSAFSNGTAATETVNIVDDEAPVVVVNPPTAIDAFDPAISKLGFLVPGQTGVKGERLEWVVSVTNLGSKNGENVVISDELNANLRLVRVESEFGTVSTSGQTVTVTFPVLEAFQTVQFIIVTDVVSGATINNTACVTASNFDDLRCSNAQVVGALPLTGATPLWASLLRGMMLALGTIALGVVLVVPAGRISQAMGR